VANWVIVDLCRNAALTEPPPEFKARVRDIDNHTAGVLPTAIVGPETHVRHELQALGISDAAINHAFTNPANCP
jgi:hypothetical protein